MNTWVLNSGGEGVRTYPGRRSPTPIGKEPSAFSMLEIMVVIAIIIVIAAVALPNAMNFVKAYRLHADSSAISAQLNVARFRATSQYTPYRMNFNTSNNTYTMDRLSTTYGSPSTEILLYLSPNIAFLASDPVTAKPGTIASTFSGISSSIYFNTRGLPVDSSGASSNNNVIYLQNEYNLYDAVTVSLGGQIVVWTYSPATSTWVAR